MDPNQTIIINVAGICFVLLVLVVTVLVVVRLVRGLQSGKGPLGSVLQQSREAARETVEVARERLQVERELLVAQKETNELLKQVIAQKGKG